MMNQSIFTYFDDEQRRLDFSLLGIRKQIDAIMFNWESFRSKIFEG